MMAFKAVVCLTSILALTLGNIHGGTFLALCGHDSVVIASDSRFTSESASKVLISHSNRPIIRVGSNTLIGCFGIESHARYLRNALLGKLLNYHDTEVYPDTVAHLISDIQYKLGIYNVPILVGIKKDGKPFIASMDQLGATTKSDSFAVVGTAQAAMMGVCEATYRPGLEAEELLGVAKKCIQDALQRDVLSGGPVRVLTLWKGEIYETFIEAHDV